MKSHFLPPLLAVVCTPLFLLSQECKEILSVDAAVRRARDLDGKVICLQGVLRPIPTRDKTSATIHEIVSDGSAGVGSRKTVIGVVEGSGAPGIDAGQYRPESFKLLDQAEKDISAPVVVVLRGALMNEKDLFKKLSARLPRDPMYDPLRDLAYSVEFVLLEVISAKPIQTR
jgi:hypothetical protein